MANPPSLTPEQRQRALEKAGAARRQRAEVKEKLKIGSLSLGELRGPQPRVIEHGQRGGIERRFHQLQPVLEGLQGAFRRNALGDAEVCMNASACPAVQLSSPRAAVARRVRVIFAATADRGLSVRARRVLTVCRTF